jgi:hypothetical protein
VSRDSFNRSDIAEVSAGVKRLLAVIQSGEVSADAGRIARLEGAIAALEALGSDPDREGLVP